MKADQCTNDEDRSVAPMMKTDQWINSNYLINACCLWFILCNIIQVNEREFRKRKKEDEDEIIIIIGRENGRERERILFSLFLSL